MDDVNAIALKCYIPSDDRKALELRLRDEDAVERIAVERGKIVQSRNLNEYRTPFRDRPEAAL